MNKEDHSKQIYRRYFDAKGKKPVQIRLTNDKVIEGFLVGFFRGDGLTEPYIIKWHFIETDELQKFKQAGTAEGLGKFIDQTDINLVELMD